MSSPSRPWGMSEKWMASQIFSLFRAFRRDDHNRHLDRHSRAFIALLGRLNAGRVLCGDSRRAGRVALARQPRWDAAADSVPIADIPGSYRPEVLPFLLQELETARAPLPR